MERELKIEKILEAVFKANLKRWNNPDNYEPSRKGWEIRLADILLMFEPFKDSDFCQCGLNGKRDNLVSNWNLHEDSLHEQSDETIDFIHSLLPTTPHEVI